MAEDRQGMKFEEIPLEEARRMGRGPRMEPMLYDTLRHKIQSLSTEAVRIHLGPEIRLERMKNSLHAIARDLKVPLTIRRVTGGLIFWRSTDEDLQQATEVSAWLRTMRQQPHARPRGRRRA